MKPMKKLGLINYEGDCLRAIKKGDKIIIKDQHGKELETTNVRGLLEFLDGYRDISDSEGKLCNLLVMPVRYVMIIRVDLVNISK